MQYNYEPRQGNDTIYWTLFTIGIVLILAIFYIKFSRELKLNYNSVDHYGANQEIVANDQSEGNYVANKN